MEVGIGLSTKESMARLCDIIKCELEREEKRLNAGSSGFRFLSHNAVTGNFCFVYAITSVVCCFMLLIGTFFRSSIIFFFIRRIKYYFFLCLHISNLFIREDNIFKNWYKSFRNCSFFDRFASVLFSITTVAIITLSSKAYNIHRLAVVARASNILNTLKSLEEENFSYEHPCVQRSSAISLQWTYRDQKLVNVPLMLLVDGDMIVLRAGQEPPCRCISKEGSFLNLGDRSKFQEKLSPETCGVIPSKPTLWKVVEPPIVRFIRKAFNDHHKKHSNLLNSEVDIAIHFILERFILPSTFLITSALCCFRYFFFTKESIFDLLVDSSLILIPLLVPTVPAFYLIGHRLQLLDILNGFRNLGFVVGKERELRYPESTFTTNNAARIFVSKGRKGSIISGLKTIYQYFAGHFHISPDFVFTCGGLTSCTFLDKNGLLSWPNASIEKLLCFHSDNLSGQGRFNVYCFFPIISSVIFRETKRVVPKVLDLTMDGTGSFSVHFDDPSWERYKGSLLPFGISSIVNGCSLAADYSSFLNHINNISKTIAGTIAVANRRCFCTLARLLGITSTTLKQFDISDTKTIGFYKRLSGEGCEKEQRKFQRPLENAFMTVTKDALSNYYHVMSQGTANLLLSACSYVWCENSVEPYTASLHKRVLDFYQHNAMTGYCLVLGYGTLGRTLSDTLCKEYIDIPLTMKSHGVSKKAPTSIPRTFSLDMELLDAFYQQLPLDTAYECLEEMLRGQTLCGLVVLQSQVRNDVVELVEQLDQICVRFIYFSKENELRSRIFAEKLGLEAGWNCHISLASEDTQSCRSVYSYCEEVTPKILPNIAKLPSGIKNIRPHLENVDNVPLLVNLFTDCSHVSCREMVEIMQDFGEVVLVLGSSLSYFNSSIFSQSNCSICIEPLHPALCSNENLRCVDHTKKSSTLATLIMGLCCDVVVFPNQTLDLIALISFCRHQLALFRSSLLFFLYSIIMILMQQISSILFLPNVLSIFQIFLFIIIYVPLLAWSLMTSPYKDGENRDEIAPKNIPAPPKRMIHRAVIYFSVNFLPAHLVVFFIYYNTVTDAKKKYLYQESVNGSFCADNYVVIVGQHVASFHLLLYLCILSASFVYFRHNIWKRYPLRNYYWLCSVCCVIFTQIAYTSISLGSPLIIFDGRIWITVMSFLFMIILVIISELCKLRFIKLHRRDQRRRKLSFNTKLGMNSPY
ncbi:unnamed protein product [Thelazia callipaeda]|uniref:WS_DGAT_C domain-containing protein n=1 Tax=Thelazia callipaeda TaxID=103827 RepID=A0A0N5CVN7_THECL|nr:unnamed protein product [Thelazia callipaeda]